MVRRGADAWIDGLYRLSAAEQVSFRPLPEFRRHENFDFAYPATGIALVLSGANGVAAVSGAVPMIVAH